MANPILDAAIEALKTAACERESQSIMTFAPNGAAIIYIGPDEVDPIGMLQGAMIHMMEKSTAREES